MKTLLLSGVFFICCLVGRAQNTIIHSWNLHISPAKWYSATFIPSSIMFPEFGPIAINRNHGTILRSDISFNFARQVGRYFTELEIGLNSAEYPLNLDAVGGINFLEQQSIIATNYTLTPRAGIGYFIFNKRTVRLTGSLGIAYNVLTFSNDYNYLNLLLTAAFHDQITANLLGEPVLRDLSHRYVIPKTTLSTGIDLQFYRVGIGVFYDRSSKAFDLFQSGKPYLMEDCSSIRLRISLLLKVKYINND